MFRLIEKKFFGLLNNIVSTSNHTKCIFVISYKFMNQPTISSLHPDEYSQELRYCPFAVNINRCFQRFNPVDDLSSRVCVPDKTEEI